VGSCGSLTVDVYRGLSSGGEALVRSGVSGSTRSVTDGGLENGRTYYYRLSFSNDCGEGPLSDEVAVVPARANPWTPEGPVGSGFTPPPCLS